MKCRKCGDNMIKNKNYDKCSLRDYVADPDKCPMCNAVDSVVHRLKQGVTITVEELKILPRYMVFDPKNDDPVEASYGIEFQKIVSDAEKKERV